MSRLVISYVLPLLLPTIIYFFWRSFIQSRSGGRTDGAGAYPAWWMAPWPWLAVSGVALLAAVLVALAIFSGARPGAEYQPPRLEDGKIRSGEFRAPSSSAPAQSPPAKPASKSSTGG